MNIFNLKLPPKIGKPFNQHFEVFSLYYHLFFISFLGYLIHFKEPDTTIPYLFIRLLGLYVICYGIVILFFGSRIMNKIKIY